MSKFSVATSIIEKKHLPWYIDYIYSAVVFRIYSAVVFRIYSESAYSRSIGKRKKLM